MTQHNFELVGADTDGIAFRKPDHGAFTDEEIKSLLNELNSLMDPLIRWENDGVFPFQLVVRAKNYALVSPSGRLKIKGSGLKATLKEKKLQRFIKEIIQILIDDRQEDIAPLYMDYAKEIVNLKDITEWCSKQTITKKVFLGAGTTQARIREALNGKSVQEGDKVYLFFKTPTARCLCERFDGVFDMKTLLRKLYDTAMIFETVIPDIVKTLPNLSLDRNKRIIEELKC